MPLREFGGRAAGGALGLQHGNIVTDGFGNIAVVFAVPFGAVPDVVAVLLDPANNYYVVIRTVNALGFTAHVRRTQTGQTSGASTVNMNHATGGTGMLIYVDGVAPTMIGHNAGGSGALLIEGSSHTHTYNQDAAAGANITVMWIAVA